MKEAIKENEKGFIVKIKNGCYLFSASGLTTRNKYHACEFDTQKQAEEAYRMWIIN
jgi:hypothetical protein